MSEFSVSVVDNTNLEMEEIFKLPMPGIPCIGSRILWQGKNYIVRQHIWDADGARGRIRIVVVDASIEPRSLDGLQRISKEER